jgi:hypothetical protein
MRTRKETQMDPDLTGRDQSTKPGLSGQAGRFYRKAPSAVPFSFRHLRRIKSYVR